MSQNVVIAGAGHAAGQLVASLKQLGFDGQITLIGDEPWLPYQRPPLSKKYLAGALDPERLLFKPASFYADDSVTVLTDTKVESIDRRNKSVSIDSGDKLPYDKLVLALGSHPRTLDVPGGDLDGITYLRTIDDVDRIRTSFRDAARIAIVGAGYIGLEVAAVAATLGLNVTVIEACDRVMSRVVSPQISAYFDAVHRRNGVNIRLSTIVRGFSGDSRVDGVQVDGETIAADAVVVGIGIVPTTNLASSAGLDVDDGIVVDCTCRSSDPDIYAIGDCTRHPNRILERSLRLESVHNALEQAKTAAANICGEHKEYADVPWFWSDQYNLKLQIVGLSEGYDDVVMRGDPADDAFSCLYLQDGSLIAIDAINSPRDFMQSKALIAEHASIEPGLLADTGIQLKDMKRL